MVHVKKTTVTHRRVKRSAAETMLCVLFASDEDWHFHRDPDHSIRAVLKDGDTEVIIRERVFSGETAEIDRLWGICVKETGKLLGRKNAAIPGADQE